MLELMVVLTVMPGPDAGRALPVSADIVLPEGAKSIRLTGPAGEVPCQLVSRGGQRATLYWIMEGAAGTPRESVRYTGTFLEEATSGQARVSVGEPKAGQVEIRVDGQPFLTYRFGADEPYPYFWPVMGPTGKAVTRAFPMQEGVPGETSDHTWHRSMWLTFGMVNGHNFWGSQPNPGKIVHRSFEAVESGPVVGVMRSTNDWLAADGTKLMSDVRELRVYAVPQGRLMDYEISFMATNGEVVLGDTKEGMMAFRVATSMDVRNGGRMENSEGGVNEKETFGRRAGWCDYSGPVAEKTAGITLMDHPGNFGHSPYWFARDYGLFAANPFGARGLGGADNPDGSYTLKAGQTMTFRYRIFIHEGSASEANVKQAYEEFSRRPMVKAEGFARTAEEEANIPPGYKLAAAYDFEDGKAEGLTPKEGNVWRVERESETNVAYHLVEPGKAGGRIRAPFAYSILDGPEVGDFILTLRVKCERGPEVRGQDMLALFGYQDPEHYYYVHFSNATDSIHNAICIVDGKDRAPITSDPLAPPRLASRTWHLVKVVRRAGTGQILAYIDDMTEPVMSAWDASFPSGRVGFGSFDDFGWFDDVRLYVPE